MRSKPLILPLLLSATTSLAQSTAGVSGRIAPGAPATIGSPSAASPAASPASSPLASPAGSPGADATLTTPSVEGTASAQYTLTPQEKKSLLSEYNRAQANEEKALRHLSRSQLRELNAAQTQRVRAWNDQQKRARREFFAANQSGPERRKYVQDYIQRKKDFDQSVKIESETARKSWSEKTEQLKTRQKDQRKKFKALLEQGKRPGPELWPTGS